MFFNSILSSAVTSSSLLALSALPGTVSAACHFDNLVDRLQQPVLVTPYNYNPNTLKDKHRQLVLYKNGLLYGDMSNYRLSTADSKNRDALLKPVKFVFPLEPRINWYANDSCKLADGRQIPVLEHAYLFKMVHDGPVPWNKLKKYSIDVSAVLTNFYDKLSKKGQGNGNEATIDVNEWYKVYSSELSSVMNSLKRLDKAFHRCIRQRGLPPMWKNFLIEYKHVMNDTKFETDKIIFGNSQRNDYMELLTRAIAQSRAFLELPSTTALFGGISSYESLFKSTLPKLSHPVTPKSDSNSESESESESEGSQTDGKDDFSDIDTDIDTDDNTDYLTDDISISNENDVDSKTSNGDNGMSEVYNDVESSPAYSGYKDFDRGDYYDRGLDEIDDYSRVPLGRQYVTHKGAVIIPVKHYYPSGVLQMFKQILGQFGVMGNKSRLDGIMLGANATTSKYREYPEDRAPNGPPKDEYKSNAKVSGNEDQNAKGETSESEDSYDDHDLGISDAGFVTHPLITVDDSGNSVSIAYKVRKVKTDKAGEPKIPIYNKYSQVFPKPYASFHLNFVGKDALETFYLQKQFISDVVYMGCPLWSRTKYMSTQVEKTLPNYNVFVVKAIPRAVAGNKFYNSCKVITFSPFEYNKVK